MLRQGHASIDGAQLLRQVHAWAKELGFSQIGVAGVDLSDAEPGLAAWLDAGFHGSMHYMARHGASRSMYSSANSALRNASNR